MQMHRPSLSYQVPKYSWVEKVHGWAECLAQEHNTSIQLSPAGHSNLRSFTWKSCALPLSHDSPPQWWLVAYRVAWKVSCTRCCNVGFFFLSSSNGADIVWAGDCQRDLQLCQQLCESGLQLHAGMAHQYPFPKNHSYGNHEGCNKLWTFSEVNLDLCNGVSLFRRSLQERLGLPLLLFLITITDMEDAHTHLLAMPGDRESSFFGVFDGHGGELWT